MLRDIKQPFKYDNSQSLPCIIWCVDPGHHTKNKVGHKRSVTYGYTHEPFHQVGLLTKHCAPHHDTNKTSRYIFFRCGPSHHCHVRSRPDIYEPTPPPQIEAFFHTFSFIPQQPDMRSTSDLRLPQPHAPLLTILEMKFLAASARS